MNGNKGTRFLGSKPNFAFSFIPVNFTPAHKNIFDFRIT